jgi:hypothetical protein
LAKGKDMLLKLCGMERVWTLFLPASEDLRVYFLLCCSSSSSSCSGC